MSKKGEVKDLTGQKFGQLTVLYYLHNYHKKGVYWLCACECGNLIEVRNCNLISGNTKSCGCLRGTKLMKHGLYHTRLYNIWLNMKNRCYNKNHQSYSNYGGRGIAVCDEWCNDFQAFYDWSMLHRYNDTLTIDRIDNDGNYSPSNCRWVTIKQQANNRRTNVYLTYNGKTRTMKEWADELGVNYKNFQRDRNIGHYFIKWCLSRFFNLKQIAHIFNVSTDDIFNKYLEEKKKYSQKELDKIMEEVYYGYDA